MSTASAMYVSEDVSIAASAAVVVMPKRELSSSSLSEVCSAKKRVKFGSHLLDSESESSSSDEDFDYF